MKIPPKLLEGFKYPLHKLKDGESAIFKWPDIAAYADVFCADDISCDHETVMRYLILMYTPGSPAVLQHPHIGKRKTWVMELLGEEPDESGRYVDYNDMLLIRGDGMRNRFVTFLMIQHSSDWSFMVHAQEELEYLMRLTPTTDPDEGMKRRKHMEETRKQIEACVDRITAADKSRALQDGIEWFRAQRSLKIRPEERIMELPPMSIVQDAKEGKSIRGE